MLRKGLSLQLMSSLWPVLTQLAANETLVMDPIIAGALCDVFEKALTASTSSRAALLEPILPVLKNMFERTACHVCLECLASITSLFGTSSSPTPALEQLQGSLMWAISAVHMWLSRPPPARPGTEGLRAELLSSILTLTARFAVFQPRQVFEGSATTAVLEFAMQAVTMQERSPVQSALLLLTTVLAVSPVQLSVLQAQGIRTAAIEGFVCTHCLVLIKHLLLAMCTTCPRDSLRKLGSLLHTLVTLPVYRDHTIPALRRVLLEGFDPVLSTQLTHEDCQRFCVLALNPQLPAPRFVSLVTDFAGIAHGVATSDDLLAYEM